MIRKLSVFLVVLLCAFVLQLRRHKQRLQHQHLRGRERFQNLPSKLCQTDCA